MKSHIRGQVKPLIHLYIFSQISNVSYTFRFIYINA